MPWLPKNSPCARLTPQRGQQGSQGTLPASLLPSQHSQGCLQLWGHSKRRTWSCWRYKGGHEVHEGNFPAGKG